jgi:chromosome segregation ATPase
VQISSDDAAEILSSLRLITYQLGELKKDHDKLRDDLEEIEEISAKHDAEIGQIQGSKNRQDLAIASLPQAVERVNSLWEWRQSMARTINQITIQAWGGLGASVMLVIFTWLWKK